MPRILIVDDDTRISDMLKDFLEMESMTVVTAENAEFALAHLETGVDLILLDINMPTMDGLTLLKKIRQFSSVPVILLTARVTQSDKVLGLGIGADDYITKPFDPMEVIARIKAILRRAARTNSTQLKEIYGSLSIDRCSKEVCIGDHPIPLSFTEYQLLVFLIDHINHVVSRQDILKAVWNSELYHENIINTNIMRLREKLGEDPEKPERILTVRGHGYIFKANIQSHT